jgi:autotransporter passenger strand-loop-strand repeat protein
MPSSKQQTQDQADLYNLQVSVNNALITLKAMVSDNVNFNSTNASKAATFGSELDQSGRTLGYVSTLFLSAFGSNSKFLSWATENHFVDFFQSTSNMTAHLSDVGTALEAGKNPSGSTARLYSSGLRVLAVKAKNLTLNYNKTGNLLDIILGYGEYSVLAPVLSAISSAFNSVADKLDQASYLFNQSATVGTKDPELFSAFGNFMDAGGGGASSIIVDGPSSFDGPDSSTQFSAWGAAQGAGFQGIPQPDGVDNLVGSATFVGESGADTFVMNGQIIAEGAAGGAGNTYIVPITAGEYANGDAQNGLYGAGTIEGQGSESKVMIADGSSLTQLTTLTITQFEEPSNFPTTIPVAVGTTNTGQSFILIQDNPSTAAGLNATDNPHNGENEDFELYIFSEGGVAFGNYSWFDDNSIKNIFETGNNENYPNVTGLVGNGVIGAHITFAAGAWSDYGITVVDDTPPPSGIEWRTPGGPPFQDASGATSGTLGQAVPANWLTGPGPGPAPGAGQSADQTPYSDAPDTSDAPVVQEGGSLTVSAGTQSIPAGEAFTSIIVSSGATLDGPGGVYGGDGGAILGTASGLTVGPAGTEGAGLSIGSGGSASSLTILNGSLLVGGGASVVSTFIDGGIENLQGNASASLVVLGGYEDVSRGGISISAVVSAGGTEAISGGLASGALIVSGGQELISAGGSALHDVIGAGGMATVFSGGSATDTRVESGGLETIDAGAVITGVTILSGGTVDFSEVVSTTQSLAAAKTVTSSTTVSGVTVSRRRSRGSAAHRACAPAEARRRLCGASSGLAWLARGRGRPGHRARQSRHVATPSWKLSNRYCVPRYLQ